MNQEAPRFRGGVVHHKAYRNNGYVCLACARNYIRISANRAGQTAGYVINLLGNLQVLDYGIGRYTPGQVAEALMIQPAPLPVEARIQWSQEGLC